MNLSFSTVFSTCTLMLLMSLSCNEREFANPYDEKTTLSNWAPQNIQIEDISLTEKKLTWKCDATILDGFRLDRKVGDNEWQLGYKQMSFGKFSIVDDMIIPDKDILYKYRLYSVYNDLISEAEEIDRYFQVNPISNLEVLVISMQQIKLNWIDSIDGEHGFRIDRKIGEGSWEVGYAITAANVTSFIDQNENFVYGTYSYRVSSLYDEFVSSPVENFTEVVECGNAFTDPRDGKIYNTTKIGNQCWMAENLNYEIGSSKCYNNSTTNCEKYGRLYDWFTIMDGAVHSNAVPSGVKGICPSGWHLPSSDEWNILIGLVGNSNFAGGKLKSTSGWDNGGNGTDEYGFNALPGGHSYPDDNYQQGGQHAYFWTTTKQEQYDGALNRGMYYDNDKIYSFYGAYENYDFGYSVRCLRDY